MSIKHRFPLAVKALREFETEESESVMAPMQTPGAVPVLRDVLVGLGPLPSEALLLGVASDNLPILFNLHDPYPGPMLIAGDSGSGKTAFLQTIAQTILQTHSATEVQFGVITNYPDEWDDSGAGPHRVGIFPVGHKTAQEFVKSLAGWAHSNKDAHHYMILLVDDLESVASLDPDSVQNFRWLLLRGPARRVWPFITLNAPRYGQVLSWLRIFRTRVFGRVANLHVAEALGGRDASVLTRLEPRIQFSLRERDKWLRFWIPSC